MSELTPQIGVLIQNDSGMDIPPRSVVVVAYDEITAATDLNESINIVHVMQYDGQPGNILITGAATIPAAAVVDPNWIETGWWSPNNSYGRAYSDQRIYVAIDESVALPVPGEEWGPVDGEWYITRGGSGFFADGYYSAATSGSGSGGLDAGADGNGGLANVDPSRAIFMRGTPLKKNWGKIVSILSPGTLESPTTCLVDVWLPDTTSSASPVPYIRATDNALLGMTVTNRGCYSVSSGVGSGSISSSSSSSIQCRIDYDNDAGEWYLSWIGRCQQVASTVACSGGGLTVTYTSIVG